MLHFKAVVDERKSRPHKVFLKRTASHSFIISIIFIVQLQSYEKLETEDKIDLQHFMNLALNKLIYKKINLVPKKDAKYIKKVIFNSHH